MQASYHITVSGIKYVVASNVRNSDRSLLLYILKKNDNEPVSFNDILIYFNNDKKNAFIEICKLMKQELIDINESSNPLSNTHHPNTAITTKNKTINQFCSENKFVLSDLNGFPVTYSGFNHQQSINISAVAYDFIQASSRSRIKNNHEVKTKPLSIKTTWQDIEIIIYLLYFEDFTCILTTKDSGFLDEARFRNLASFLCNRYNYD